MVRVESDHLDATLHALVGRLSSVPGLKQVAQKNLVNHESMVALRQLVEQDRLD
jgi:hypothetical protein